MIGTFICGGLGNQMFQYAAARALSLRLGTTLQLDMSAFGRRQFFEVPRPFELDLFDIQVTQPDLSTATQFRLARRPQSFLRRLSRWTIYREREIGFYDERFTDLEDDTYLYGYWQSWRYFEAAKAVVHRELQPTRPLSDASRRFEEEMRRGNSVSLHIRRGDYLSSAAANAVHGVLGTDFYAEAVRHIQAHNPNIELFVFSDDLEWCEQGLAHLGLPLRLVNANRGRDSWQDLFLMAACRHAIVANSSFSWWGAWLGDVDGDLDRIVVAPKEWFSGGDFSLSDHYPPGWTVF